MLEPILEETSDDENQEIYDSIWSSESDTGSVIRVDLTQGFYFFFKINCSWSSDFNFVFIFLQNKTVHQNANLLARQKDENMNLLKSLMRIV